MFSRSSRNPILTPLKENSWESWKVYNPGAIYHNDKYYIYYRALGKDCVSSIGLAISGDGEIFERFTAPILSAETEAEKRGLEDPRITQIGDKFLMAYAAYDGITPRLNTAVSTDLTHWSKQGPALKKFGFQKSGGVFTSWKNGKATIKNMPYEWSKSGAIFPEKINGKYCMLFGEFRIWLAWSQDGITWEASKSPFIEPRTGDFFDNTFVEMGPPPILTKKGWLVLYHGINDKIYYRLGWMLLDRYNPEKIIYRSSTPIFGPEKKYELSGAVDVLPGGVTTMSRLDESELELFIKKNEEAGNMPKVAFCSGAILNNNLLRIYYGASDTNVCTATARLEDILMNLPNI